MRKAIAMLAAFLLASCASMPRGQHGERWEIRGGWITMQRLGDHCRWQQREYAARITCNL